MATIESILRDPVKLPFRKAQIKRRQASDGLYEANWFDITSLVEKWGTLQTSVDALRLNQFIHSGIKLTVRNDYGEFNSENDGGSLFFDFFTRYRTKVRIQAGYTDGAGNQFPTDPTQGIFILDGVIKSNIKNNTAILNCKSIFSPFQEERADNIGGITSSITSFEIMEKIRDMTDGSGNVIFRQFISSTSWSIQSTTANITRLGTTTALSGFSVWELMNKLAEFEGFMIHATRTGGIKFANRLPNTSTSKLSFFGAGFRRPNIIRLNSIEESVDKLFTHIRFKYLDEDTETSFITAGTQTTVGIDSLEWKYGRRTYEFENQFVSDSQTAEFIVNNIKTEFSNLRSELKMDCVFTPQLEILDPVDVSYREGSINSIQLWDFRTWAANTITSDTTTTLTWASETSSTIDFNKKNFKILSRKTNLDNFTTSFQLREIEN